VNSDLMDNAADPEQVARASRKERDRERRRLAVWRQQMSTPDGREHVWDEELPALWDDTFGSVESVYAMLGRRREALRKLILLNDHFPREFLLMWTEGFARRARERKENEAARTQSATSKNE
jgi:hypothetical protein